MEPTHDIESLLAVQDNRDIPIFLRGQITGRLSDDTERAALRFFTALTSICARHANEEYAATYQIDSRLGVQFVVAGSEPVPSTVQDYLENKIVPILRFFAENPISRTDDDNFWSNEAVRSLLRSILSFTLERYKHRFYFDSADIWASMIDSARSKLTGVDLSVFEGLLKDLEQMKVYIQQLRSHDLVDDGNHLFGQIMHLGVHINRTIHSTPATNVFYKLDGSSLWSLKAQALVIPGFNILVDTMSLEDNPGRLKRDFSFARFSMHIASIFDWTKCLIDMAHTHKHVFGPSLRLIYMDSEEQQVALDTSRVLQACNLPAENSFFVPDAKSVTARPHAAMSIVLHILNTAVGSRDCTVKGVIGSSTYLCAGCDSCLRGLGRLHGNWKLDLPVPYALPYDIYSPGATRKVQFPWVLPQFPLNEKAMKLLREYIFDELALDLRAVARGITSIIGP